MSATSLDQRCPVAANGSLQPVGNGLKDRSVPLRRGRRALELALLVCVSASVAVLCSPWWPKLLTLWRVDPNYSHGPLVLLLSVGLMWRAMPPRAIVFGPLPHGELPSGIFRLLLGIALNTVAWFTGIVLFGVIALVWMLRGIFTLVGGKRLRRATDFATLFLLFMAPLPASLQQWLSVMLQGWAAVLSSHLLQLFGMSVFREGALLHLPNHTLEVGVACSGLRQLTAFVALGCLAAYFGPTRRWSKLLLVAIGPLVAVVANSVRVLATAWILMWAGPSWVEGLWHDLEATATIALGAVLVALAMWATVGLESVLARQSNSPSHRFKRALCRAR